MEQLLVREIIEDFHKTSKDRLGDQSKNIGSPVVL